jgi:restriction system protein
MGDALRNSTGAIGTVCDITKHATDIEILLGGVNGPKITSTDSTIE